MNKIKLKKYILFILIFILYFLIIRKTDYENIFNNEILTKINIDNVKSKVLYDSLNKIISYDDINLEKVSTIKKTEPNIIQKDNNKNNDNSTSNKKAIVYIYNSHQTEEYNLPFVSDYSITPTVKLASFMLKDFLNDYNINSTVEKRSIKEYINKNKLDYTGSYEASRKYITDAFKENDYKIIIDVHRDSARYNHTLFKKDNKKYARVLFVLSTKHKNYKKNEEFTLYLNNKLNKEYKGISRGIYRRDDAVFNQDLCDNAILLELGGVDNTIEELNNTLEVFAKILNDYIKEKYERK